MSDLDVQGLLEATLRRGHRLRMRRRLFAGSIAVASAVAIAVPVVVFSGGAGRQGVIVSPGPSAPTSVAPRPPGGGGSATVTVPDVVGQVYLPAAEITVGDANLVSEYSLENSASAAAGTVIAESPPAGSMAPSGSTVTLVVSTGPADIPGAQPCRARDLKTRSGEPVSEASGQSTTDWSFTNLAGPCVLNGYPTVTALDGTGRPLGFIFSHAGDEMTTGAAPQPVFLPKGSSAWIRFNKYRCDVSATDAARSLKLVLPSGGGTIDVPSTFGYCSETPSLAIAVSPFEPVEMLLSPAGPPLGETDQITYQPFAANGTVNAGLRVTNTVSGSCNGGGVAGNSSYRCFSQNSVLDPCFARPGATRGPLICTFDPSSRDVVELDTGSAPLPSPYAGAPQNSIWAMQLENGQVCVHVDAAWGGLGPLQCRSGPLADCHVPDQIAPWWTAACQPELNDSSPFVFYRVDKVWL